MKRIILLVLVVIVIIATYWVCLLIRSPQEKGLQHIARLNSHARIIHFANNSNYFIVQNYSPCLCLYDVKGDLLGQINLQEYIDDVCFNSRDNKLGVLTSVGKEKNFIVVDIDQMSVLTRQHLPFAPDQELDVYYKVFFSSTTETWIVLHDNNRQCRLLSLKESTAKILQDKSFYAESDFSWHIETNLYPVPEAASHIFVDTQHGCYVWDYLSNDLISRPVIPLTLRPSDRKSFSGPFPHTFLRLGKQQKNYCLLVYPLDSDTASFYSSPLTSNKNYGDHYYVKDISDDGKTMLLFYDDPGAVLRPSPAQRFYILDVPSMREIAYKIESRNHVIRDISLSPNGKYLVSAGHTSNYTKNSSYFIDIYNIEYLGQRVEEKWHAVK